MLMLAALLGLFAGIGLNLLADDLPTRTLDAPDKFTRPLAVPVCAYCGQPVALWRWSGLAARLAGRAPCPHCTAPGGGLPARWRPALVEIALAAAFALLWQLAPAQFFSFAAALWMLLLIAVIDLEHRLILYIVAFPAMAGAALLGAGAHGWRLTAQGGLAGFGIVAGMYALGLAFAWAIHRVRGDALDEVAFGWGDVLLGAIIGLLNGWPAILFALGIAVLTGGAGGLIVLLAQIARRRHRWFTAMPYGPFLALGGLAVFLGGPPLMFWLLR